MTFLSALPRCPFLLQITPASPLSFKFKLKKYVLLQSGIISRSFLPTSRLFCKDATHSLHTHSPHTTYTFTTYYIPIYYIQIHYIHIHYIHIHHIHIHHILHTHLPHTIYTFTTYYILHTPQKSTNVGKQ